MKSTVVICVLFLAGFALAQPGDDHYTSQYDNVNMEEILNNDRLYEAYFKCLLDLGKCTPDIKEVKKHMKEAMENGCAKCTEKQKKDVKNVIKHLINHKKNDWVQLTAKYDPENKYRTKYEDKLREIKA